MRQTFIDRGESLNHDMSDIRVGSCYPAQEHDTFMVIDRRYRFENFWRGSSLKTILENWLCRAGFTIKRAARNIGHNQARMPFVAMRAGCSVPVG